MLLSHPRRDQLVNATNHKGSTPLHLLCYQSDRRSHPLEIADLLIEEGAEIDAKDQRDMTPLLVCCTSGRIDFMERLIQFGANLYVKDATNKSAIDIANFYRHESVVKFLDSIKKKHK